MGMENSSGGATNADSAGGVSDNQDQTSLATDQSQKNTVSYETYRKVIDEIKMLKGKVPEDDIKSKAAQFEEMKAKLAALENEKRQKEEDSLRKRGDFEKLLKMREDELAKYRDEAQGLRSKFETAAKYSSFLKNIEGNIAPEYIKLAEDYVDQIPMNPETGAPDDSAAKMIAMEFRKKYAAIIQKPNRSVGIPSDAAKVESTTITYEEWLKLPKQEMQKRLKDVMSQG
jgi:hypothetical protein